MTKRLTHIGRDGAARMVDVSSKSVTRRRAVATAQVRLNPRTLALIRGGKVPKGDVFAVARIAAVQAAKQTSLLVPLCHPLPIEAAKVDIKAKAPDKIMIRVETTVRAKTGVEMEALVAAAAAALAIYDMCKAVDRGIVIGPIQLQEKSGGRSGTWRREKAAAARPS